ncbi:hypothetical protein ABVK25_005046 [Lepraria finkii]|uniref:Uncharacterized protein n=1 Tax=Lepraria finkii TaxID=1340010 RepID=A0ABR4BA54_9LECA
MRVLTSSVLAVAFGTATIAQNCGPQYANQMYAAGNCLTVYHFRQPCDTGPAYCDPTICLEAFSGPGSSCAAATSDSTSPYASSIPNIDVCGAAPGGISCPGAGVPPSANILGYYYRCYSAAGHCGPKNNI